MKSLDLTYKLIALTLSDRPLPPPPPPHYAFEQLFLAYTF